MFLDFTIYSLCLIVLGIGSYTDLRTREVPDWVNYGLIFAAFGTRLIYSLALQDFRIILDGVLGFALFFVLAVLLYYTGQWGGGDSKMLMGIGSALGISSKNILHFYSGTLFSFLGNLLIFGGLYGILWSLILVLRHRKNFAKRFSVIIRQKKVVLARRAVLVICPLIAILALLAPGLQMKLLLLFISFGIFFMFYVWVSVRAIEKACMIKRQPVEKLTEGDWIVNEIVIDKKRVCGPKDLGITNKQIAMLKKLKAKGKITHVMIKEGIPFIPSFMIAFAYTLIKGSILAGFVFYLSA